MPTTTSEKKPSQRVITSLSVALAEGAANYLVETANVSNTGLCLRPKKVFPVGTQLRLVFGRPPELPRITVRGIVRWSEGGKGVGVQFTYISPHDHEALLTFVNSQSRGGQAQAVAPPYIQSQV